MDSGGAGKFRGGLGYEKHIRMLKDAHFMSIADRSILACWGVKGGLAGKPFEVTIDPGGPNEREVDALADAEPIKAGEVVRIRTTGGGGWGNPLERDPSLVVRDVVWRKVSPEAALAAYGVVLTGSLDDDTLGLDEAATAAERALAARGVRGVLRPRAGLRPAGRRSGPRRGRPGLTGPGRDRPDAGERAASGAVVGGHGKTGRAVSAALTARGACPVPLGRADWADLAGALAGCRTAYLIAPTCTRRGGVRRRRGRRRDRVRRTPPRAALGRLAVRARDPHHAARPAPRTSRRWGRAWTILQPGASCRTCCRSVARSGWPTAPTPVRVRRPRRPGGGGGDGAVDEGHAGATSSRLLHRAAADVAAAAGARSRW